MNHNLIGCYKSSNCIALSGISHCKQKELLLWLTIMMDDEHYMIMWTRSAEKLYSKKYNNLNGTKTVPGRKRQVVFLSTIGTAACLRLAIFCNLKVGCGPRQPEVGCAIIVQHLEELLVADTNMLGAYVSWLRRNLWNMYCTVNNYYR